MSLFLPSFTGSDIQLVFCVVCQGYSGSDVFIDWRDDFSMPIASWIALLSIAYRFQFTEVVEHRARREVFKGASSLALIPVKQISLTEKHSVPLRYIIPALENLYSTPGAP